MLIGKRTLEFAMGALLAALLVAPNASALDLTNIFIWQTEDFVNGVPNVNPFGLEVTALGTGITAAKLQVDGGAENSLVLEDGEWYFEDMGYASLAALRTPYPTGNSWLFTFNEGLGDEDTVTINFNPNPVPTGLIGNVGPAHGATGISLDPTLTWDDCSACGADSESILIYESIADTFADGLFNTATNTTNWSPTTLNSNTLYQIEWILNGDDTGSGPLSTIGGDGFNYDAQFERINQTEFTTIVPEPSTALLLGMGIVLLSTQRRKRGNAG